MRTFILALFAFLNISVLLAQTNITQGKQVALQRIVRTDGNVKIEFDALKNDTTVKNGSYFYYYKNKLIEKGQFTQNKKSGLWQFYNLKGIFEFEYNYDSNKITRLSGNRDPKQETPCLFKGSPLIPYLYIVQQLQYPDEAQKKEITGQVVLALKIGSDGQIWAMYISKKLHPSLDAEVMRVARKFPSDWEWLPATRFEQTLDDEYLITIEFELD